MAVHLPAKTLFGIEVRTSNDPQNEIVALWNKFRTEDIAEEIPERADETLIAAYHSYEHDHTRPYTFFLGCEVIDVACAPDGFVLREIPAGTYEAFSAQGEQPQALIDAWKRIWDSDLRRTYAVDFEVHDPNSPDLVEIFIGIH
ncbi:MAG: GyrI-like domain-containing protein [Fuerstiella sp.]